MKFELNFHTKWLRANYMGRISCPIDIGSRTVLPILNFSTVKFNIFVACFSGKIIHFN